MGRLRPPARQAPRAASPPAIAASSSTSVASAVGRTGGTERRAAGVVGIPPTPLINALASVDGRLGLVVSPYRQALILPDARPVVMGRQVSPIAVALCAKNPPPRSTRSTRRTLSSGARPGWGRAADGRRLLSADMD